MGMKVLSIKTKSLKKITIIICIVIRYLQKLSISVQHQLLKKKISFHGIPSIIERKVHIEGQIVQQCHLCLH